MANQEPTDPPDTGQLLQADLTNHVRRRVGREVEDMIDCADELRGLGTSLDGQSALETHASPEALREAAVGVRAVAMQAFMSACRAAGISARLHARADIVGIVELPDDEAPDAGGQGASAAPE
jgi:hypothetical protein